MRHQPHSFRAAPTLATLIVGASVMGLAGARLAAAQSAATAGPAIPPGAVAGTAEFVSFEYFVPVDRTSPPAASPGAVEDPGTDGAPPESGPPDTNGIVTVAPGKGTPGGSGAGSGGSLTVVSSFAGEPAGSPPDTNLAVGPRDIVEFVNSSAEVWTHSGRVEAHFSLNSLFDYRTPKTGCGDGRVVYDPATHAFFASYLGHCAPKGGPSEVDLAVSLDPSKGWDVYKVSKEGLLQDQPKIGFSDDKVMIAWNEHGSQVVAIQKAGLLEGLQSVPAALWGPYPARRGVDPAVQLSPGKVAYAMYHTTQTASVGMLSFSGDPGVSPVFFVENDFDVPQTVVAPPAVQPPTTSGPPAMYLDTEDDRLQEAVWRDGQYYSGLDDYCKAPADTTGRACMQIYHVDTTTMTMVRDVELTAVGGYVYFPALTLDRRGNLWIAFTSSSSTQTASSEIAEIPGGTFPSSVTGYVYHQGPGTVSGCRQKSPNRRWGDYSGIAVDPAQGGLGVWAATEYGESGCKAGTAIGEFHS